MSNKVFQVSSYTPISSYLIIGIVLMMVIGTAFGVYYFYSRKRYSRPIFLISLAGLATTIAIFILCVCFSYSSHNVKFILNKQSLQIKDMFYGQNISKDAIFLEDVQLVSFQQESAYFPSIRTNGIGFPGYWAGWFKLNNGEKALVFLTDRSNVVYIPTKAGYSVLLSPAQPKEFLQAMHELWKN